MIRTSMLILSVVFTSGFLASCDDDADSNRYTIGTVYSGPNTSDRGYPYIGVLLADKGQIDIHLDQLPLYAGPAAEAFIVDRTHPSPNGAPVLSFPGPHPSDLSAHLSATQVRQMVNGDYTLVVRTSGVEAAQVTGQPKPWPQVEAEARKDQGYFVQWSRPAKDAYSRQSGAYEDGDNLQPDANFFHDPRSGALCWSVDYRYAHAKREVVTARISLLDGKAPLTFTFNPGTFLAHACLPAGKAVAAALAHGHVQVTIATAAVPAGEFAGPLNLKRLGKAAAANPVF